jgi:hypothetical protein
MALADPAVRRTGDRRPLPIFFSYFFLAEIRKKKLLLSQIGFENCFLTMTAAPFGKPPSPH